MIVPSRLASGDGTKVRLSSPHFAFHITVTLTYRNWWERFDVDSNAGRSGFDVRPVLKGAPRNRSEQIRSKHS
jgi:hypothetical protein